MPIVRHSKDGVIKSMPGLNNTVKLNVTKPYEFIKTGPHSGYFIIARGDKVLMESHDYYEANDSATWDTKTHSYKPSGKGDGDKYIQKIVDFIDQP
jgi:hypothetical protein